MNTDSYTTKNLNLASYLYACDIKLTGTKRINDEVFFLFTPKADAEALIDKFFSNTASVNPRELFARFHDLKDLIFSQKGGKY